MKNSDEGGSLCQSSSVAGYWGTMSARELWEREARPAVHTGGWPVSDQLRRRAPPPLPILQWRGTGWQQQREHRAQRVL